MSIQSLIDELTTSQSVDIVETRAKIQTEFDAAITSEQRGQVLAIFKATMDHFERSLIKQGNQEALLEDFRKARLQDYKIFIVQECTVGLDSPGGGDISVQMLKAVTDRETAAGRMDEDQPLRKLAVDGIAAPHLTHAELIAKHAALKLGAEVKAAAPKTIGGRLKALFA